jgi:hypothetical protein
MEISELRFSKFNDERINYATAERLMAYENVLVVEEQYGAYTLININNGDIITVYTN